MLLFSKYTANGRQLTNVINAYTGTKTIARILPRGTYRFPFKRFDRCTLVLDVVYDALWDRMKRFKFNVNSGG